MSVKQCFPSDVRDAEWAFVAPYFTLMAQDGRQYSHELRQVSNALRYRVRTGAPWRYLPGDFPPWYTVYPQTHRWIKAGCFEAMVHDLRSLLRLAQDRSQAPSAVIFDARTIQSIVESGAPAGFGGYKKQKGSIVHTAVDTLGHLLALRVTPANEQERAQVGELSDEVQEVTGGNVNLAYVDQGYTGDAAANATQEQGIELHVVGCPRPSAASCCSHGPSLWS